MAGELQKYNDLRAQLGDVLNNGLASFLSELCEAPDEGVPSADRQLSSLWDSFHNLKTRYASQRLTVAVLALTKSGKSTLLNAIIGAPLLPANNVPETARIVQLRHTPAINAENATLTETSLSSSHHGAPADPVQVCGVEAIQAHLRGLNEEVRCREYRHGDEAVLEVAVPFAALGAPSSQQAHDVTLQLLDTPGPNEAGEEGLRAAVERLLDGVDAAVYLLDYTKLKTRDEACVLERLKGINPTLVQRLSSRLFFVVNKMDTEQYCEGLGPDATRAYVAELITSQMALPCFCLKPEQVMLVSARDALLSRLVLTGRHTPDTLSSLCRLAFGRRDPATVSMQEYEEVAADMLQLSGLPRLEETVLTWLYREAGSVKLQATADDALRLVQQLTNITTTSCGALRSDAAELTTRCERLQRQLTDALSQFDDVLQQAELVEGLVSDNVSNRMAHLKHHLFERVSAVIEACQGADETARPRGRWANVWAAARAAFGVGRSSRDRAAAEAALAALHAEVQAELEAEVRDFWAHLESSTNTQQRVLYSYLNAAVERLSRAIEAAVSARLEVTLAPVELALQPPSAQQFHDSLQELLTRGIHHRQRQEVRSRSVRAPAPWHETLCRMSGLYGPPQAARRCRSRTVQERYNVDVYELEPDAVLEYFIEKIDGVVDASLRNVRSVVREFVHTHVDGARRVIEQYAEQYTGAMLAALETAKQGEAARKAALERSAAQAATLAALEARLRAVHAALEGVEDAGIVSEDGGGLAAAAAAAAASGEGGGEAAGREEPAADVYARLIAELSDSYRTWSGEDAAAAAAGGVGGPPPPDVCARATPTGDVPAAPYIDLGALPAEPAPLLSGSYLGSRTASADVSSVPAEGAPAASSLQGAGGRDGESGGMGVGGRTAVVVGLPSGLTPADGAELSSAAASGEVALEQLPMASRASLRSGAPAGEEEEEEEGVAEDAKPKEGLVEEADKVDEEEEEGLIVDVDEGEEEDGIVVDADEGEEEAAAEEAAVAARGEAWVDDKRQVPLVYSRKHVAVQAPATAEAAPIPTEAAPSPRAPRPAPATAEAAAGPDAAAAAVDVDVDVDVPLSSPRASDLPRRGDEAGGSAAVVALEGHDAATPPQRASPRGGRSDAGSPRGGSGYETDDSGWMVVEGRDGEEDGRRRT